MSIQQLNPNTSFQQNIELFTTQRQPGELDLISEVRNILCAAGLNKEVERSYDTNQYIIDGANLTTEAQRFLLNRFWNIQLIALGVNSVEQRFCLIDSGEYKDWIKLFKESIVPYAVSNRLPMLLV